MNNTWKFYNISYFFLIPHYQELHYVISPSISYLQAEDKDNNNKLLSETVVWMKVFTSEFTKKLIFRGTIGATFYDGLSTQNSV